MFDLELSQSIGEAVRAENKDCYINAFRGVARVPGAVYVEGFAVMEDFPLIAAHAWIEKDGTIIDPTPAYHEGDHRYFPAVRYTTTELFAQVYPDCTLPLVELEIFIDERVQDAYREAHRFAFGMTPEEMRERFAKARCEHG